MRRHDYAPLYRTSVGFDRLFSMLDNLSTNDSTTSYPPYNIEKIDDNAYRIIMAVAGFKDADLSIEARANLLTVQGEARSITNDDSQVLHQGIAARAFERRFHLADHVEVVDAKLADGLLTITLKREIPEALKPKMIPISASDDVTIDVVDASKTVSDQSEKHSDA